jgi:DNA-binding response OmpR family regulator
MAFLLVDADRNFRDALAIALRLDGHEVRTASEGREALDQLERGGVRCCVVDWAVAGVDDLLEAAVRSGVCTVLTGVHTSLVHGTARRHPRAKVLPKPFGAGDLVAAIA